LVGRAFLPTMDNRAKLEVVQVASSKVNLFCGQ
jgi:hypothetical protein